MVTTSTRVPGTSSAATPASASRGAPRRRHWRHGGAGADQPDVGERFTRARRPDQHAPLRASGCRPARRRARDRRASGGPRGARPAGCSHRTVGGDDHHRSAPRSGLRGKGEHEPAPASTAAAARRRRASPRHPGRARSVPRRIVAMASTLGRAGGHGGGHRSCGPTRGMWTTRPRGSGGGRGRGAAGRGALEQEARGPRRAAAARLRPSPRTRSCSRRRLAGLGHRGARTAVGAVEPLPLNTMPTDENTLRSCPAHSGHSVSEASEKDCTASNRWSQAVQAY